jgi:metal-responsive CopG/Arc/MetJ family transcriptional regulator
MAHGGKTMTKTQEKEKTLILSFRLPELLIKRVDSEAEKETRTRANMVQVLLQEALDKRQGKK